MNIETYFKLPVTNKKLFNFKQIREDQSGNAFIFFSNEELYYMDDTELDALLSITEARHEINAGTYRGEIFDLGYNI